MEEQLKIDFNKAIKSLNLSEENIRLREKNLNIFIEKGFPNRRVEEWKFSDLNQIIKSNIDKLKFYDEKLNITKKNVHPTNIEKYKLPDHNKIVIVNGFVNLINFDYEEINKVKIETNVDITNKINKNSLISLNNAFVNNAIKITIKENYIFKKPLIIYDVIEKHIKSTTINEKIDIILEDNSYLKMINISDDHSHNNFINVNQQFIVGKNAVLKNYKIDDKDNSNIKYFYNNIELDKNSISETFIYSKGSKFIKNEVNCNLNDDYSSAFINGVINLKDAKHHEIKTNINHLSENTKSYQLVKSVLNDNSKGVFQGKIFVDSRAQKTDGYQLSKALLLNENTEFDAKPELEIYADDVKCSHGSTSGNLDENAIFYLMSRGLNYQQSRKLLINGFLLDVVEKITDHEIKNFIKNIMEFKE